jgi:hypothetical protein
MSPLRLTLAPAVGRTNRHMPEVRSAHRWCALIACMGAILALPGPLLGQGSVHGRVLDEASEAPVQGALIELLSESGRPLRRVHSDVDGRFALTARSAARHRLRARSVGYSESITAAFDVPLGDTVEVVVRIGAEPIRVPALEIVARSSRYHRNPGLASFQRRMERGLGGTFITRREIEQRNPTRVTDILRDAGVTSWGSDVHGGGVIMGRTGCVPMVYLDGVPITYPWVSGGGPRSLGTAIVQEAIDAVNPVSPMSVEGIEVYRGAASLPAEFGGSTGQCGVIAIWARRG